MANILILLVALVAVVQVVLPLPAHQGQKIVEGVQENEDRFIKKFLQQYFQAKQRAENFEITPPPCNDPITNSSNSTSGFTESTITDTNTTTEFPHNSTITAEPTYYVSSTVSEEPTYYVSSTVSEEPTYYSTTVTTDAPTPSSPASPTPYPPTPPPPPPPPPFQPLNLTSRKVIIIEDYERIPQSIPN